MPYIKDSFSILAECAAIDLPDTQRVVRESEVRSGYENIEEASEYYAATVEMVPVIKMGNEYYTEAQFMAPFMRDAGIRSMTEALDCIAEANNLPAKSVGLLIESECAVSAMIEKACGKGTKAKDNIMDKIGKATDLVNNLKSKGYPVKRKVNEADMKTADDFHKKKQDEKNNKSRDEDHRLSRSGKVGRNAEQSEKNLRKNPEYKERLKNNSERDEWGNSKEAKKINDERYKKYSDANKAVQANSNNQDKKHDITAKTRNTGYAADAKMRHDRRHGVKEEVEDLFNFDSL